MQITVEGHATAAFPPERATVHLSLGFEGSDKEAVLEQTTRLANQFSAALEQLRDAADSPTTWSALLPIGTRSWRPYANDGTVLPMRYAAHATAKVKFRDFGGLSRFIDVWGARSGVSVGHVEWALTEKRTVTEEEAVLARAVAAARRRAETMAQAAGAGGVRFLELADPGLLQSRSDSPETMAYGAKMRSAMDSGGEGATLVPEDVELQARVHARFTTD